MVILPFEQPRDCAASGMNARTRLQLALDALAGVPVCHLALVNGVSRKFVSLQRDKANLALLDAFDPPGQPHDLLFWLPVTKSWIRQLVLGLVLLCHSSCRGACELLDDLFDHSLSLGSVHNIVADAATRAAAINSCVDLSAIRIAALDEIFQAGQPVLAAADAHSGYCCLLGQEEHRDGDTWGTRLLELQTQEFAPEAFIADFGSGLRNGAKQAMPDTPCRADIFHPLRDFQAVSTYLENRAYDALKAHEDLLGKQKRYHRKNLWKSQSLAGKAVAARREAQRAIELADDLETLLDWFRQDVLAVAADDYSTRCQLYDWIVEELRTRERRCEHRIRPIRVLLENHRDELLAFAEKLDEDLTRVAARYEVRVEWVREALAVQQMDEGRSRRWQGEQELWSRLGGKYAGIRKEVQEIASRVVRASSVIENLNSRLRNYFFLRKQLGSRYLPLLQFYLNHKRFSRSERQERQGKSPREVLSGQEHAHWLELLGYQRFRQTG